jgi:hypothetical protein
MRITARLALHSRLFVCGFCDVGATDPTPKSDVRVMTRSLWRVDAAKRVLADAHTFLAARLFPSWCASSCSSLSLGLGGMASVRERRTAGGWAKLSPQISQDGG